MLRVADSGKRLNIFDNFGDIHHGTDIDAAMAYENAHPLLFIGDIPFRRVNRDFGESAACGSQQCGGLGRRARSFDHRFRNVLWLGESPRNEYTPGARFEQARISCFR